MANTPTHILLGHNGNPDTSGIGPIEKYLTAAERTELQKTQAAATPPPAAPKKKVSLMDILTGAGTVMGSFLGAKQATKQQITGVVPNAGYQYYPYPTEQKKDNTMIIILAAIAVIVVIVIIVIATKKKTVK